MLEFVTVTSPQLTLIVSFALTVLIWDILTANPCRLVSQSGRMQPYCGGMAAGKAPLSIKKEENGREKTKKRNGNEAKKKRTGKRAERRRKTPDGKTNANRKAVLRAS